MDDSAKKRSDATRGAIGGFVTGGEMKRILDQHLSLAKLTASSPKLPNAISRAARGLPGREVAEAMAKITAGSAFFESQSKIGKLFENARFGGIDIPAPLSKYGALRKQIEAAMGPVSGSPFGKALATAGRLSLLDDARYPRHIGKAVEAAIAKINAPFDFCGLSAARQAALGIDTGAIGALTRSHHWASAIGAISDKRIDVLLGTGLKATQLDGLRRAIGGINEVTAGLGLGDARPGSLRAQLAGMEATSTKLSLFAGSIDVLGPGSSGGAAAYEALLGGYSTPDILVQRGMRDPRERARLYRDLNVDPGLIESDNASTVAVLVDSGLLEGERTRNGTVTAVVEAGPVRMRIMASRPKMGAFGAIDAFETGLRAFVAGKLEAAQGPNWFKQRVPGALIGRAKDRRREAMRAGETGLPLIQYIDLGDLITVIVRKDNWAELFEAVFDRPEPLRVDLERLTANRRPTMHSRPIDPVQLCEIMLIIRRLTGWMERDGRWDIDWDADI
ncbi:MAG: hypothetical protein KGL63_14915 [Betaproteobacteria bacterium]|nr:hypothetical protein [Betaproteobacteria bacterium]